MWTPERWDFGDAIKDLSNFQETMEVWEGEANAFLMGLLRLSAGRLRMMLCCKTCVAAQCRSWGWVLGLLGLECDLQLSFERRISFMIKEWLYSFIISSFYSFLFGGKNLGVVIYICSKNCLILYYLFIYSFSMYFYLPKVKWLAY